MDVRKKLVDIVCDATQINGCIHSCNHPPCAMVRGIVDALFENGVTVQECISVKDRLPARGDTISAVKAAEKIAFARQSHIPRDQWQDAAVSDGVSTLDILTKAARRYGTMQIIIAMEELAELQQALAKGLRFKPDLENICEEIADVEIMLLQIRIFYSLPEPDIDRWKAYKIDRLKSRMEIKNG